MGPFMTADLFPPVGRVFRLGHGVHDVGTLMDADAGKLRWRRLSRVSDPITGKYGTIALPVRRVGEGEPAVP